MFSYHGTDIGVFVSNVNLDPQNGGVNGQYKVVKLSADKVAPVAAIGDACFGVLQNQPRLGSACTVRVGGVSKVVAGEAIAINLPVYLAATGKVLSAGAATGARFIGTSLSASTADGELLTVLLAPQHSTTVVK